MGGDRLQDFYEKYDYCPPYTLRAKYWRQYCPQLAMTAVHKALKEWGGDKNLITHVVSHSTTGWDVPGLSHHVMYNLELPTSARAVPVNFVGCQGGTSAMFVASSIAKQDPNAVVLALCAEIQSPLGRMYNDCANAVHPGGKKLLQNFESLISDHGVENASFELKNSYKNLRQYGNLASAAIIFILGDVCRETKKDSIYFMAMGPGVCLEYGGMKRYKAGNKAAKSNRRSGEESNLTPILFAIIIVLVGFIL